MNNLVERVYGRNDLGSNTLLVIGNGFDLDLGLKTKYIDFANSDYWPFKKKTCFLGGYLNRHKDSDEWFDLEAAMAEYCEKSKNLPTCCMKKLIQQDRADDTLLIKKLQEYLTAETSRISKENNYRKTSIAYKLLSLVCTAPIPGTIYSFNYTDLKKIASALNINVGCHPHYVHGELAQNNIILGINGQSRIRDSHQFLIKMRRPGYKSSNIFKSFEKFDNIIFYGLSFGHIDNIYFKGFFENVIHGKLPGKYIRIITKDESSRQKIFLNLKAMTGSDLSLFKEADFKVLSSDGSMSAEISNMFDTLQSLPQ